MNHINISNNRQLISQKAFILGVDPSKTRMDCVLMDTQGNRIGKAFSISKDYKGFNEKFPERLKKIIQRPFNPSDVVIAIECSMNYWKTFGYHCDQKGHLVVLTSPLKTHHGRPLMDGDFSKTDQKDANIVAENALSGRFNIYHSAEEECEKSQKVVYTKAHELSIYYHKLDKDITAFKQRLCSVLDVIFPEFPKLLNPYCKTGLYLLEKYCFPGSLAAMDLPEEFVTIDKISKGKVSLEKLKQIVEGARNSIGVKELVLEPERALIIKDCINAIVDLERRKDKVIEDIKTHVSQTPWYSILISIKGLGEVSAALFIAEAGDLSRFRHYRQLEKFAGLNLRYCDSGLFKGQRKLSRLGNKRLRCVIYSVCNNMRKHDPMVRRKFLKRRIKSKGRCFTRDVIALSSLCLRIIMSIVKQKKMYDINRVECPQLDYLENDYEVIVKKAA